jgi:MHS family proline/betaine transporter-like MFS transporter
MSTHQHRANDTPRTRNNSKLLAAGIAGNLLEWFDFAIYGFFAVTIGKLFFPNADPVAQVIASFGVFAVGFLMRPIGGVVLGHIGDKHGRHTALIVSVAAMAIPTFLVGVLPTYATLGLAAPILLLLLRMVQGLSVGGEYTTSIIYMIEHTDPHKRGLIGSFAAFGAIGGMLLGSGFGAFLATILSDQALQEWGWRVPFLLGLFIGIAGLYLRREPVAQGAITEQSHNPFKTVLKYHRTELLQVMGMSMVNAVIFYLAFIYLVSWLETIDGIPPETALRINTVSLLVMVPVIIFGGWLSDRVGPVRVMIVSAAVTTLLAWPFFWMLHQSTLWMVYAGQLGFALTVGPYFGAQPFGMVAILKPAVRCTAAGLGYNITLGVAGGFSPMVATWLVSRTHDDLSPAFMIMAAGALSIAALLSVKSSSASNPSGP